MYNLLYTLLFHLKIEKTRAKNEPVSVDKWNLTIVFVDFFSPHKGILFNEYATKEGYTECLKYTQNCYLIDARQNKRYFLSRFSRNARNVRNANVWPRRKDNDFWYFGVWKHALNLVNKTVRVKRTPDVKL